MSRGMAVTVTVDRFGDDFICGGLAAAGKGFDTNDSGEEKWHHGSHEGLACEHC